MVLPQPNQGSDGITRRHLLAIAGGSLGAVTRGARGANS